MFVWFEFFGASDAAKMGAHNRVTLQFKFLPPKAIMYIEAFANHLWISFNVCLVYLAIDCVFNKMNWLQSSQAMGFHLSWVFIVLPVAFTLMTIRAFADDDPAEDGIEQEFRGSNSFLIPNGFRGYWHVLEATTKHFVIRDNSADGPIVLGRKMTSIAKILDTAIRLDLKIVLSEGEDPRVMAAAIEVRRLKLARLALVGRAAVMEAALSSEAMRLCSFPLIWTRAIARKKSHSALAEPARQAQFCKV